MTGNVGWAQQISRHVTAAGSIYRDQHLPRWPYPIDTRRAGTSRAAGVCALDRCGQCIRYDKAILVGNGHTPAPLRRDGLRTRRGIHRTIRPLVARARGLAGLLPCRRRRVAARQDGIHSLQPVRSRTGHRTCGHQRDRWRDGSECWRRGEGDAAGSLELAAALLAMPPAFLQPLHQPGKPSTTSPRPGLAARARGRAVQPHGRIYWPAGRGARRRLQALAGEQHR